MSKKVVITKIEKLVRVLSSGRPLTLNQIKNRTGLVNPTAQISTLRSEGWDIRYNNGKYAVA